MINVKNKGLLNKYINNTGISKLFSQDMSNLLELFSLNKGDFLINEGECSDYLYFLVSGKLKVFSHSTSGKIMSLNLFNSFEIIGETGSLWNNPPTASVQASSKAYCIGISMKHRDILLNDVIFLRYICKNLGERLSYMNNTTCINLYEPLENRLASFILKTEENGIFSYNLTECAELLCASYRHLLRVINLFCSTNKLIKEGKSYKILDRDYLESISHYSLD
ncbi:cyclic nucleotide-binding domain-containing protein [Clostridium sp.]|jgi:CRP/FNR family putative post-exponential-phase nitrogen-starvation transcriptional regulator|uniref:cyclic nucleotide-binding domain-containing protein n=1 Tax=Clostridium sp. TaxID=1506 RepID=UPI0025BA9238|nr:cyclic nucleotide-binding domain-containing protein [Clostridium sp.]MCI9069047.1 cyclic nucleotide-binding domain-containing protein [Clostridium sp.]MCI9304164.1 cyclic nucleotide-binding domain-containing protein [Clostridium sp.]